MAITFPVKTDGRIAAKGADYLIYVRQDIYSLWLPLGGQRDGGLEMERETIDMSESRSDGWGYSRPGLSSWSIDLDSLIIVNDAAAALLRQLYMARAPVLVQIRYSGGAYCTGTGEITDLSEDYPHDDAAGISGTIEGVGPLTFLRR